MHSRALREVLAACTFSVLSACGGADFTGTAKTAAKAPAPPALPAPAPAGGGDAVGTETASATATATDTASATSTSTATAAAAGCQPSRKIAFVNCLPAGQANSSTDISKGGFDLDVLGCDAASTAGALQSYDSIVYFGPLVAGAASGEQDLPSEVASRLTAGAKVVYLATGGCEGTEPAQGCSPGYFTYDSSPQDILEFEDNVEFPETIGSSTVSVPHANSMTQAFSATGYGGFHINHLMFGLGSENEWCSDLVVAQPGPRSTTFHAFLADDSTRKGLLVATTLAYQDQAKIDFADPFLAAQLNQPWNQAGNSAACGLPCSGTPFSAVVGMGKPVIYLYPKKEEDVSVRLDLDGKIVASYPEYDAKIHGWSVRARPDGTLIDKHDGREHSYLYWSGESASFKPTFDEGFVVKGEDTQAFLQKTLATLGMTDREANDMIVYWLPYMQHHKYNLISFAKESYERVAKMTVTPKPDAVLRVFMVFKHLDQPIPVKPPRLEPFKRKGFTVVEWGGSEIDGDWHVLH